MGTHCLILTIGNLVSPPSFPFAGQVKGRTGPPPPNERSLRSWLLGKTGPSSRGSCCVARGIYETRCLLIGGGSSGPAKGGVRGCRVRRARRRCVAQLSFTCNPVLDIVSAFAPAL